MGFELGKGHLNGVEIWRVWRQEEEPTALRPECGSGLEVFVCGEVVADHDRSGLNFWYQNLADVGCKASPSIAPVMTQGAMRLWWVRPAMKVCVPHAPKGAFISNRSPRRQRPLNRVRLVLTEVSSMNTSLAGWARIAGIRCLNHPCRRCFTRARSLSAATSDFFYTCTPACAESDRWRPHVPQRPWPPQAHLQVLAT